MLIEVFKSGCHTDSNGIETSYSLEQINQIVNNYNQFIAEHPNDLAPLVKGHPQNNAPAFGWVKRLIRKNDTIIAEITDIDKELQEDIKNKKFKNFSIALYPNLLLRHIGILGAVPPAVKGLNKYGILNFHKDAVYNEYDYLAENKHTNTNFSDNICDESKQPTNEILEQVQTNKLKEKMYAEPVSVYSNNHNEITDINKDFQKLKDINSQLINKLHSLQKQTFLTSIRTFAESICSSPNSPISSSTKDVLIDILEDCYDIDNRNININDIENYSLDYCENQNGLTGKIKRFVSNLNNENKELCKELAFKEYSDNNILDNFNNPNVKVDFEKNELHKKALRYMALHSDASYTDALDNIL